MLTGAYAVAKTLRSGVVVCKLVAGVRNILQEEMQILQRIPDGLAEEWAFGQVCAKQILALVKQGDEEQGVAIYDEFVEFFAGPWTGLGSSLLACFFLTEEVLPLFKGLVCSGSDFWWKWLPVVCSAASENF